MTHGNYIRGKYVSSLALRGYVVGTRDASSPSFSIRFGENGWIFCACCRFVSYKDLNVSYSRTNRLNNLTNCLSVIFDPYYGRMRYVAAYLLAALGGNTSPNTSDIKNILSSVGIDVDDDKLKIVMDELKGKDLQELIAAGKQLYFFLSRPSFANDYKTTPSFD